MKHITKNAISLLVVAIVLAGTMWAVQHFHQPGSLDVVRAQSMDMSQMRPPAGAAPVALATVRSGSLDNTITYTGSVRAFNEQDIAPRIAGTIVSLTAYPGDRVRSGQLLAQLDSAEVSARVDESVERVREARIGEQVAHLTHHLHHGAALLQSQSQLASAQQSVTDAQLQAQASDAAITQAQADVRSAQANANYWKVEVDREKQLVDAGAVSRQDYQNEQAQAQSAFAAVSGAQSKLQQAKAMARSSHTKIGLAHRQVDAARAGVQMAEADITIAEGQASQAGAETSVAQATAREASVVAGYTRIVSPADGVVIERPIAPGTLVQPGAVILKIAEIDRVRVQANVAVSDVGGIQPGTPVTIVPNDGGQSIKSTVSAVFPAADVETRTAVVEAVVPNPGHRLLPGAFVSMHIAKRAISSQLSVPSSSIVMTGGQSYVWVAQGGASTESVVYECTKCHMHYTAEKAAKLGYIDPMDGGKLVPIDKVAAGPSRQLTAHQVAVHTGASDGTWTTIESRAITAGATVVAQGIAGLTEGTRLVETAWGVDGPKQLPQASVADAGQKLYRCEKCGMTYSEADATKNHFIDPMDGGKLVPVTPPAKKLMPSSMGGMKM